MEKFWKVIAALYEGKELKNSATWKNAGALTSIVTAIFVAVTSLVPDLKISVMDQHTIVNGIVALMMVVNGYLHIATSSKVGIGKK